VSKLFDNFSIYVDLESFDKYVSPICFQLDEDIDIEFLNGSWRSSVAEQLFCNHFPPFCVNLH